MTPERKAQLAASCRPILASLQERCGGLLWASVSTADGIEVAAVGGGADDKLSVMSGTMLALAGGIVSEASLGACRSIILDAEGGRVAVLSVPGTRNSLVLAGMAQPDTTIGMLLASCLGACNEVAEEAQQPEPPRAPAPAPLPPPPPLPMPPPPPPSAVPDPPKPPPPKADPPRPARSWPWRGLTG